MNNLIESPLGKPSTYYTEYKPELLFPIARQLHRDAIHIKDPLPFYGIDAWNAYELSWLNPKGKPIVAIAEFYFPCTSPFIIESKSFKLYLNSFNNSKINSLAELTDILKNDLSKAAGALVDVNIKLLHEYQEIILPTFSGICLDDLDIECENYVVNSAILTNENTQITETVFSDLLKSNCLVTGQPDWASLQISYSGKKICHENLLKYIVSFRNHNEFHEHCVERIYVDIMQKCSPEKLTVYARYTRRGGLDINPYRSTENSIPETFFRLNRQ